MADISGMMSSFLPTIKCSMCAQDIEISMMGEHICAIASQPTPPPETDRTFENNITRSDSKKGLGFLKPRVPLALVDTAAANRPFLRKDQLQQQPLTPVSASSSYRTLSPYSSVGGKTPYDSQPPRSATAPLPIKNIPSPEKSSGSFNTGSPRFGGSPRSGASITESPKQVRSQTANFLGGDRYEEPEQYAPVSPRSATSGGLLQRMNTIAPGPFDVNGRKAYSQRTASNGSTDRDVNIKRQPTTSHKPQASIGSYDGERLNSDGLRKPRVERAGGYGGFGPPSSRNEERIESPSAGQIQSQMFPSGNRIDKDEIQQPIDPNPFRRPSNAEFLTSLPSRPRRPSAAGPDLSRPLPPRGASFIGGRDERRLAGAPVPGVDLASEFGVSNPYHTASESQSSTTSGTSQESNASSRSSPSTSTAGSRRKPSNTKHIDLLKTDLQSSMADLYPKEPPSNSKPLALASQTKEKYARPGHSRSESQDPAIQGGSFSPVSPRAPSPPPLQRPANSKNIRRPATAKGNCKGCNLPIKGKSVSSADGRLSGRWHKSCFVCKTCSEPFATASFYVLDDAPYCERHYHKLNGSVCQSCDRGIEGQYLETQRSQKYHPNCLKCSDCKRILKRDYFEMNGKVYCERDAFRRAQQRNFLGPGGATSRMERRTTKLMMMA